jgi:hypothetical protein
VSEENPNPTPSEPGSGEPGGSGSGQGGDGGQGGTQAADQFAAERETLEARARSFQSEADKAKERAAAAEAELARLKGEKDEGASGQGTPAPGLTEDAVVRVMRREQARASEVAAALETAKADYPNAEPAVLRADQYDTAEELLAAAEASHKSVSSHLEARLKAEEEALRKRYAERYGELPAPVETGSEGGASGDPSIAQLNAMSQDELDALEKRDPGVIDRVLRSNDQLRG